MLTTMPVGFWERPDRASRALFAGMIKDRQWSQARCACLTAAWPADCDATPTQPQLPPTE